MIKIYLTGSTGFVGTQLMTSLKLRPDYMVVTDLPTGPVDYIINLASASDVQESIGNPAPFIANNVDAMLHVMEYARKYPPRLFMHMSTVEAVEPRNPYAASKAAQEAIAIAYQSTYGLPITVAMSHNIVGQGQKGKFIPTIIEQIKKGETVSIYTQNGVIGSRTYNPVANVVDGLIHMLTLPPSYYNIDSGKLYNNLEMAQKIAKLLDKELKYRKVEGRIVRPGYSLKLVSDGVPLTSTGWKPKQTLDQGLAWLHP